MLNNNLPKKPFKIQIFIKITGIEQVKVIYTNDDDVIMVYNTTQQWCTIHQCFLVNKQNITKD